MDEEKTNFKEEGKGKKGGKRFGGGKRNHGSPAKQRFITDGSNDPRWYGTDEVVRLAANYSFFKSLGLPVNDTYQYNILGYRDGAIPGILALQVMDALPVSSGSAATDAINVAARQQYALIRKANSGAKNYEWNDLIVYEMARSSLNEIYAFIARAYGVATKYNMQNRYMPKALLKTMGFDPDDFISNLASIRLWLNNYALKVNTLALPHSLSYFERKAWLYAHIYTDSNVAKAQVYMLTPSATKDGGAGFLKYDPTISSNGGCLIRTSLFANGDFFTAWSAIADQFVDVLLTDDDSAIISGDILKAYGDGNLFKCNPIPEDFDVPFEYNEEVLSQIENAVTAPHPVPASITGDSGDDIILHEGGIVQDGAGNLLFKPYFDIDISSSTYQHLFEINPLLNFHHTDVTPDQVMVGTRLTATFAVAALDNTYRYAPQSCGTEIVTSIVIVRDPEVTYTTRIQSTSSIGSGVDAFGTLTEMLDLCNFDWAPKMYISCVGFSGVNSTYMQPFGEIATYRTVFPTELAKLHDTATLYLFGVPLIESYNK